MDLFDIFGITEEELKDKKVSSTLQPPSPHSWGN